MWVRIENNGMWESKTVVKLCFSKKYQVVRIFHFFAAHLVPILERVITYPETATHRCSQVQNLVKLTKKHIM